MSSADADVAVVGGGLIGVAAALGLARLGARVVLLERQPPQGSSGRFGMDVRHVTLSPASAALLEQLGVWRELDAVPFSAMRVWEDWGSQDIRFDAAEVGRTELGWIVENAPTLQALFTALEREPEVRCVFGGELEALELMPERAVLQAGGASVTCRLVVGVDGARSTVRELVNAETSVFPTGHHALATLVQVSRPHRGLACQRFLLDGPLALLPSREPKLVSVVWSQSPEQAARRRELPEPAFCAELGAAIEGAFGAVEATDARFVFPVAQHLVERMDPAPRVLLLGDAAHVLHPLAGFGANLGFEDVRDLLERFAGLPACQDPGSARIWRRFARQRKARAGMLLTLMATLRSVYAEDEPLLVWLRNHGVRLTGAAAPLKRQIMREALGITPLAARW